MSVNSKVLVACGKDKALEVGKAVHKALQKWLDSKRSGYLSEAGLSEIDLLSCSKWSSRVMLITYDWKRFRYVFGCGDGASNSADRRYLGLTVINGEEAIFSIGQWGSCREIMMVVADTVCQFGEVFYADNDQEGELVKMEVANGKD